MQSSVVRTQFDKFGIICSGACAAHCLLTPFIALASPAFAKFFENEWIHIGLLFFVIPIALIAFYSGYKSHKQHRLLILGFLGVFLLLFAVVAELFFHIEIEYLEFILTALGSTCLIMAHLSNMNLINSKSKKSIPN